MGMVVLTVFILCAVYVQKRGQIQHEKITRKITDHANFLAPLNCMFYVFSKVETSPYVDIQNFPELKVLKDNWEIIRSEALALDERQLIRASDDLDDVGFSSFFKEGWKRFYISWYGVFPGTTKILCPVTLGFLRDKM